MRNDALRELLRHRVEAVGTAVLESGDAPSQQAVEDLERLERLAALATSVRVRRWPAIALSLVLLVALSAYVLPRLSKMDVDLDVTTSELSLVVPTEQIVIRRLRALVLGVSGVQSAELPSESGPPGRYKPPAGAGGSVRLIADGDSAGTIDLDELRLPAEATVRLSIIAPHRLTLVVKPAPQLTASVLGTVSIQVDRQEPQHRLFPAPRAVIIEPSDREIALDLALAEEPSIILASRVAVSALSFTRPDPSLGTGSTILRRPSAIVGGALTLMELGGRQIRLHRAEGLRMDGADGEIGTLALSDDLLAVQFRGAVSDLRTGSEARPRCLMPRRLEWLAANDAAGIAWTGVAAVVGYVLAVMRWWRSPT